MLARRAAEMGRADLALLPNVLRGSRRVTGLATSMSFETWSNEAVLLSGHASLDARDLRFDSFSCDGPGDNLDLSLHDLER
jgi:hypothetical protein